MNFILETGVGSDQFSAGLAAAQAAHIPVVEAIQNPEQVNGIIGCVGCQASTLAGEVVANWIISELLHAIGALAQTVQRQLLAA